MKSYHSHLASTTIQKSLKIKRNKVLRSSAIFPFMINKDMDTNILFMGYWLLKRNLLSIDLKIKIRLQNGKLILKKIKKIKSIKAFKISVKKILGKKFLKETIIGSIELEIFSKKDMVYPYPALVVNFEGKKSSSVVHTCGRIYNNKNDLKQNNEFIVPETGIDILPNKNFSPFFSFVNGNKKIINDKLSIKIINYLGEELNKKITLQNIKPYQTEFIFFLNEIEKKFLRNKKGSIKIKHNFKSFFPRFLSGNMDINKNNSSLTHTYYDTSNQKDKITFWKNPNKKIFYDSTVSFPIFKNKNSYTELVVYPNFPKCNLKFNLEFYNELGKCIKILKSVLVVNSKIRKPIYLNIKDILKKKDININKNKDYLVKLIIDGKGKVPTRLKFGLNLGLKKKYDIPTNICFNAHVPNERILSKPGTFKWCPILNKFNSSVVITNTSNLKNKFKKAVLKLNFWNEFNGKKIQKNIVINDNGVFWFDLNKDIKIRSFLKKGTGWLTVQSDNPFVNGWYFESSEHGFVGGDHLF